MSSPETMFDRANKYVDSLQPRQKIHGATMMYSHEVCAFAEKESLDRAIEELERVVSNGATHYRRDWIEQRIAELKLEKGEVKK